MNLSATFRDRLRDRFSGAAIAIALQAGLLALLMLSFQAVRHMGEEKENILILPPPAKLLRAPVTIDARGKPPQDASKSARPAPTALLPYALPSFNLSAPQSGSAPLGGAASQDISRDIARCRVENYANLNASERQRCPPPDGVARRDPNEVPLNPDKPVKNAPVWQAEVDRRNAPASLPGASGGILGILGTLLFNPGAYGDKRNYSYGPQDPPPMDGAEMTRQYALNGSGCPDLDDTTKRNCQHDRAAVPLVTTGGVLAGNTQHVSDTAFQQALAATQARTRSLYGAPVLASGANKGGGDAQNRPSGNNSGNGGAGAGGDNGAPAGAGGH